MYRSRSWCRLFLIRAEKAAKVAARKHGSYNNIIWAF